jgi:hypothetical protein
MLPQLQSKIEGKVVTQAHRTGLGNGARFGVKENVLTILIPSCSEVQHWGPATGRYSTYGSHLPGSGFISSLLPPPWGTVTILFANYTHNRSRNNPPFMEPTDSLPRLKEQDTGPHREPAESSPQTYTMSLFFIFNIIPSAVTSAQAVSSEVISQAFLVSPILSTCPVQLILTDLVALLLFSE